MSQRFEMRLSDELAARIDAAAGDLPRATWIKRTLEEALAEGTPEGTPGKLRGTGTGRDGDHHKNVEAEPPTTPPAKPAPPRASRKAPSNRGYVGALMVRQAKLNAQKGM